MSYGSEHAYTLNVHSGTFVVISALPVNNILHAMLRTTTSNIIFMVKDKETYRSLRYHTVLFQQYKNSYDTVYKIFSQSH